MTSIGATGLKLGPGHGDPEQALAALAKVELVISDCDGTLLYTDKSLGEPAKEAVRNLTAAGVRFTVASSRPGKGMHSIVESLGSSRRLPLSTAANSSIPPAGKP